MLKLNGGIKKLNGDIKKNLLASADTSRNRTGTSQPSCKVLHGSP